MKKVFKSLLLVIVIVGAFVLLNEQKKDAVAKCVAGGQEVLVCERGLD